jgi:hypothetical protein
VRARGQAASTVRRLLLLGTLLAAGLVGVVSLLLPPRARAAVDPAFTHHWPVVRGAYHVHSERSDGTGTLDEIAAAAAAAGLQFVIITDHGDGTRAPEPPSYRSGVLCLDGVEISTDLGHYVALGLRQTPYRLAGHPRDVIEDVHRFGGFGFAAHPGSPKPALRWHDWEAPFHGLEWLNGDSEWRDEAWGALARALLTYAFRPTETLTALLDRPEPVLRQWDRLTPTRRVPVIAGADAHARFGLRQRSDPYENRVFARVPSYEVTFRAFSNYLVLDHPLSGDADADAWQVLSAIYEGRLFTALDGLGVLSLFEARATSGARMARIGEYLEPDGPVLLEARVAAPDGTTLSVLRDGSVLHQVTGNSLKLDIGDARGAYRFEVHLPGRASLPWILTNPIYVGVGDAHARAAAMAAAPLPDVTRREGLNTVEWRAEASQDSTSTLTDGVLDDGTPALDWRFALAPADRQAQYAAIRFPIDRVLYDDQRLQLRGLTDRPRRVWAQLRAPGDGQGERWGTTFYLDESLRSIELRLADFRPIGALSSERPALDRIDSLLLVVDTLNTPPGTAGQIAIPDMWMVR